MVVGPVGRVPWSLEMLAYLNRSDADPIRSDGIE